MGATNVFQREQDAMLEKQRRRAWKNQAAMEEDEGKTTRNLDKERREAGPPKGKGKGKKGGDQDGVIKVRLRVDPDSGAGLELRATPAGYAIDAVEDDPGRPGVDPGDTITAIAGVSLAGLDENELEDRFGDNFGPGVEVVVEKSVTEVVMFPQDADCDWDQFSRDLNMFSEHQGVRAGIKEVPSWRVTVEGPKSALLKAMPELRGLMNYYFPTGESG